MLEKIRIFARKFANYRLKVHGESPHTAKNCAKVHAYPNNRRRENAEKCRELSKRFRFKRNCLEKPRKARISSKFVCITFSQYCSNPEYIKQINRNSKEKLKTVSCFHTANAVDETLFHDFPNASHVAFGSDRLQAQKNQDTNAISMINLFHKNIAHGPEYVCTCCDQLWYKSSVVKCDAKNTRHAHKMWLSPVLLVLKVLMPLNGFV